MNGNLSVFGAGLTALAATTGLTPVSAFAQSYPGGLYAGIHLVAEGSTAKQGNVYARGQELLWLDNQAVICTSPTAIGCAFTPISSNGTQTNPITGVYLEEKWADYVPCASVNGVSINGTPTIGGTCTDPLSANYTIDHTFTTNVQLYTSTGKKAGTLTVINGASTATYLDDAVNDIVKIEQNLGIKIKVKIGLTGGDYLAVYGTSSKILNNCGSSGCEPSGTRLPAPVIPATNYQYNTPYWVMSTIYNNTGTDGTTTNGYVYSAGSTGDTQSNCYVSPVPWGSIYSQLYAASAADFIAHVTSLHFVAAVKLGGMNGHDQEIAISGNGNGNYIVPGCGDVRYGTSTVGGAAETAWLNVEHYSVARAEKAFQYFAHSLLSNVGTLTALDIALSPSYALPDIVTVSGTPTIVAPQNNPPVPVELLGGMVVDLFGGVSSSGTTITPVNLISNLTTQPPFGLAANSGVTYGRSPSLVAVQTDGLANLTACYPNGTSNPSLCTGSTSDTITLAPAGTNAPTSQKLFTQDEACQLTNLFGASDSVYGTAGSSGANNILSQATTFTTYNNSVSDLGPFISTGNSPVGLALGLQNYPLAVQNWSETGNTYSTEDVTATIQTAQLAATFGANFAEIWANGIAAVAQAGSISSLAPVAAALSAGNTAHCYAGWNSSL